MRKCWQTYHDNSIVLKCFYSFILPFFEYCSIVWMSAAPTYIKMLDRVFASARFLAPVNIKLDHRRDVAAACLFYKIVNNPDHPMHTRIPPPVEHARRTRRTQRMNSRARASALSPNSAQFNRTFLPRVIEIWNFLPQALADAPSMDSFKRNANRHLLVIT